MRLRFAVPVLTLIAALGAWSALTVTARPQSHRSAATRLARDARARTPQAYAALPLTFETNVGQTDPRVRFISRGAGYSIFLTGDEAVVSLATPSAGTAHAPRAAGQAALAMKFLGARSAAQVSGLERLPARVNYFVGNDPARWHTGVPSYARVKYTALYPGVDLIYYGNQQSLEYDLVVSPGANPDAIRIAIDGADDARLDRAGDLLLIAGGSELRLMKPRVYQHAGGREQIVDGRYVLAADGGARHAGARTIGVELGAYDHSRALVIDPQLVYSTFLGGSSGAQANAIAVDSSGRIYVTGTTASADFPVSTGAFEGKKDAISGEGNVFVTELDPTQSGTSQLVFSTYLGGNGTCIHCPIPVGDAGYGIALNSQGQIYVAGFTPSLNFPVTANAFQRASGPTVLGFSSGFLTVLDPTQTGAAQLVYSSYLGGDGEDYIDALAVDSQGFAYVTGDANSSDFPVTQNVFEPLKASPPGIPDAFVSVINPAASGAASLVYSSYLGGSAGADGTGVAVGPSGQIYVTGDTASQDFPTTANALQPNPLGLFAITGFVTVINTANKGASQLAYSTHLGGSFADAGLAIAADSQGLAYVTGFARSGDFPVTSTAFQTHDESAITPFVSVINPTLSGNASLLYSTFLGGIGFIGGEGGGIAVDSNGLVYVTGFTCLTDFPIDMNFLQAANAGGIDAFVSVLNPTLSGSASLTFSTYLGGSSADAANAIAVDSQGFVYVAGITESTNFPVTDGALQPTKPGSLSGFVAILNPSDPPDPIPVPTPTSTRTPRPTPTPKPTPTPTRTPRPTPTPKRTPTPAPKGAPSPAKKTAPTPTPKRTSTPKATPRPI
jgi:hypothetical protein